MNQEHEQKAQAILEDLISRGEKTIPMSAFKRLEIDKLVIPEGIENIEKLAFWDAKINELILPNSIKEMQYKVFVHAEIGKLVLPKNKHANTFSTAFHWFSSGIAFADIDELYLSAGYNLGGPELWKRHFIDGYTANIGKIVFNEEEKKYPICEKFASGFSYIEEVVLSSNIDRIGAYAFYRCRELSKIHNLTTSVKSIDNGAFGLCAGLKEIDLPQSLKCISDYCFTASGLESVQIPESVTTIGEKAFLDCNKLTTISLSENLTEIGESAFQNTPIKTIVIPDNVKKIKAAVFKGCENLEEIYIPKNVKAISPYTFQNNSALKKVIMHENIRRLGKGAFESCKALESITLPKKLQIVGTESFKKSGLLHIEIPENVTEIQRDAFAFCQNLKNIELPPSLTVIENGAFRDTAIESITIPEGVVKIEQVLFQNCKSLKNVEILGACEEIDCSIFENLSNNNNLRIKFRINPENFELIGFAHSYLHAFSKIYLSKDGTEFLCCKEKDKALKKTHFSFKSDSLSVEKILLDSNYRQNFVKLSALQESKKIKFMPSDFVLETFPTSLIENFFVNNNHVAFSKLIEAMGLNLLGNDDYKINACRDFMKIYYAIGGFSPVESERAKAFNYFEKFLINNDISVKQGKKLMPSAKVDVQELALGIHRRFDGINLSGPYNHTFAKFFMKYFHENPDFMKLDLSDEDGFMGDGEMDFLCQAHNRFSQILADNPNMLINTTSRALKLTPEFVAKASKIISYENIKEGNIELAKLIGKYGYSQARFEQMQEIFEQAKNTKEDYVIVADKASEENCVRYRFLEKDDPLGFVIGNITNCCQHLGGAGASCTIDGFVNPNSGFMVFEEKLFDENGQPTGEYRILGQAYIWYNKEKKTVCLDNIEIPESVHKELEKADASPDKMSYLTLMKAVQESAEAVMSAMNKEKVMVEKVTIGTGYNDLNKQLRETYGLPNNENIAKAPKGVYSDAKSQYTILTYDEYTKNQAKRIKKNLHQSQEILNEIASENTLQSGREN